MTPYFALLSVSAPLRGRNIIYIAKQILREYFNPLLSCIQYRTFECQATVRYIENRKVFVKYQTKKTNVFRTCIKISYFLFKGMSPFNLPVIIYLISLTQLQMYISVDLICNMGYIITGKHQTRNTVLLLTFWHFKKQAIFQDYI